jgi:hypothetical protein
MIIALSRWMHLIIAFLRSWCEFSSDNFPFPLYNFFLSWGNIFWVLKNFLGSIVPWSDTFPTPATVCLRNRTLVRIHSALYVDLPTSRSRIASGERRSREPRDRLVSLAGIWIWLKILARKLLRLIITHVSFTFQLNFVNRLSFDFSIVDFRSAQIWEHSNF